MNSLTICRPTLTGFLPGERLFPGGGVVRFAPGFHNFTLEGTRLSLTVTLTLTTSPNPNPGRHLHRGGPRRHP